MRKPPQYVPGEARLPLLLAVLLGLLATAAIILQMGLLSWIIARVFLNRSTLSDVMPAMLGLLAAGVLRAALTGAREYAAREASTRVERTLRLDLIRHLLRAGPAFTRLERTGELVTLATAGLERVDVYISRYLPQVALSAGSPLLIAAVIFPFDTLSAVLLLVTAPIIPVLMVFAGSYAQDHIDRQWIALSRMGAHFLDSVQGLGTLVLFGRGRDEVERVARISERYRQRSLKALRSAFVSGFTLEFMTAVAIGIIAVELGIRLLNGAMPFDRALFILLLTPEFYRPLRDLGMRRHAGMEGKTALTRYTEVTSAPAVAWNAAPAGSLPRAPFTISLVGVTYRYAGAAQPALRDLTLTLHPATVTALVGPTGAGKSTLAQLIMRILEPDEGEIRVNGLPLRDLSPDVWRRFVAVVPQRPYLFAGTLRENVLMAHPDASDESLREALRIAGAEAFVHALPHKYETLLGERGARLSAGEAQRIAIARAILKDAPLLIMDEPTSHLDPESEAAVREAMTYLTRHRTVLVIAHRINTVATAQQIAVLDAGRITQIGTHDSLLASGGLYAQLVRGSSKIEVLP